MICYIDDKVFEHQEEWYEQAAIIYKTLPRNDLSFGDWKITQTHDSLRFQGTYFVSEFTENPTDVAEFTVIFFKDPEKHFSLQFNGRRSQRLAKKYHLRGYLENEVVESLYNLGGFPDFIYSLSLQDII
tara:strand:- start:168 stop:554 length:387 start_codon:yes stop_codon:yes gene_type:complete